MVEAILGYFTALGLSTAAGLNAYLPLLVLGLLSRSTDLISLPAPWDRLEDPVVLAIVATVAALDFVGDKVPIVDHLLHAAGLAIAPIAGGVAALASANALAIDPTVAGTMGILAALATHLGRTAARPLATATTGGAGNPAISLGEDGLSGVLSITAVVWPVVAFLIAVAVMAFAIFAIRRWRALGRRISGPPRARSDAPPDDHG